MFTKICHLIFIIFVIPYYFLPWVDSTSFSITQFSPGSNDIVYEGDATLSSAKIDLNALNYQYRVGHATYAKPIQIWDSETGKPADFSTRFSMTTEGETTNSTMPSGGLAFFLSPVGYSIPPNSAGGFLGLFNTTPLSHDNRVVMVEFDTFSNKEWDPEFRHVGINSNSIASSVYAPWDVASNKVANVWISYNSTSTNLSVFWTYEENPTFNGQVSLSYTIHLEKILPEWVTIGFSAATGAYPERHTVSSWEFSSNLVAKKSEKLHHGFRKTLIIVTVVISFVSLSLIAVVGLRWWIKKRRLRNWLRGTGGGRRVTHASLCIEKGALPRKFSYHELKAATNRFSTDRRLGQGGSGHVYKGTVLGRQVAVKRIFAQYENSEKNFVNEVKIISCLVHRNLVKFLGWCHERGEFLLVYEYMPNGSLDMHLFGTKGALGWEVRYRIALGLASALNYLHEDAGQCVLHRDVKAANILLDIDFGTKLGDFGIAKLVDPLLRTQKTGVVGTLGYLAPEYLNEGRASKESDMYSFGVVALEIVSGRRKYEDGEFHIPLVRWVWQLYLAGVILSAGDERLEGEFDEKEMECLLIVGLWCTNPNKSERPKAGQVIKVLQFEVPLPELMDSIHDQDFSLSPLPPLRN